MAMEKVTCGNCGHKWSRKEWGRCPKCFEGKKWVIGSGREGGSIMQNVLYYFDRFFMLGLMLCALAAILGFLFFPEWMNVPLKNIW